MATRVIDDTKLQNIAVAIQGKDSGGTMTVDEMPTRIAAIQTGDEVLFSSNGRQYTRTVEIPNNVTTIGEYAFQGCSLLETIDLNDVTSISSYAFSSCVNLHEIDLKNVTTLGNYAFNGCSSFKIINTKNISVLSTAAFRYCFSLETAICRNVATMDGLCFWNDNKLKYVDCRNATSIRSSNVFEGCSSLELIDLTGGNSVCTLSKVNAFNNTNNTWIALVADSNMKAQYQSATNWSTYADHFKTIAEVEAEIGMTYDEYYYQLFGEPRNEVTP